MDPKKVKNKSVDGLTKKVSKPKENFFSDLDKKARSFSTFWVVVALVLLIVFVSLVWSAISIKRKNIDLNLSKSSDNLNLVSFAERLNSVHGDGRAILVFNNEEFAKAAGTDEEEFPFKNAKFDISKDKIYLIGKIKDSIIPWSVKIRILATVKDQSFQFLVAPDTMENMVIYGQNKDKIEATFNKNINEILSTEGFIADDVLTSDGSIEMRVIKEVK
jgi:hypothetical protein